jgi:uncharacterized protein (TIGR03792 family)
MGWNVYNLSVGNCIGGVAMWIEWLVITVPLEWQERYLAADEAIWTSFLASCPGYRGKEIWREAVVMVIRWASREEWKAIDPAVLATVEAAFVAAVGQTFAIEQAAEYAVSGYNEGIDRRLMP